MNNIDYTSIDKVLEFDAVHEEVLAYNKNQEFLVGFIRPDENNAYCCG